MYNVYFATTLMAVSTRKPLRECREASTELARVGRRRTLLITYIGVPIRIRERNNIVRQGAITQSCGREQQTGARIVVPKVVVVKPCFCIIILAWETQVEGDRLRVPVEVRIHGRCAERIVRCPPNHRTGCVRQCLRSAEMVAVDVVEAPRACCLGGTTRRLTGIAMSAHCRRCWFSHVLPGAGITHAASRYNKSATMTTAANPK